MKKSASSSAAPSLATVSYGNSPNGSHSTTSLEMPKKGKLVPVGVSPLVASRMRLDATMAPSLLNLRMNPANLINEMRYNGGKIVSHQFALMKPRRKQVWEKPAQLSAQEQNVSKTLRKLQRKVARRETARMQLGTPLHASEKLSRGLPHKSSSKAGSRATSASDPQRIVHSTKNEESDKWVGPGDPGLDIEVSRLIEDARVEEVWRTLGGGSLSEEELLAGAIPNLPRSRTIRALQAMGHQHPDEEIVKDCLLSLPGDGPLDLNEFTSIVAVFNRHRRHDLKTKFRSLDEDGSGTISAREFRHFLWDLGFTVTDELVQEYLNEADADRSGEVEFAEFEYACQLVQQRHGFSLQEIEEFDRLFDRYDSDGSCEIEADELASALGYFGNTVTLDQAREIISRFDDDGNGTLAKPEFLMVMRVRLEEEISDVRSLFSEFDRGDTGTMGISELLELFMKIGYSINAGIIEDAIKVVLPTVYKRGAWRDHQMVFEDVLRIFHIIRKREGFSEREIAELTDVFNRHDQTGKGELREFELARCFNWMGYPLSQQKRRELWCRIDVDKTESIDLSEFLKLAHILREEETSAARSVLEQCSKTGSKVTEPILKNMLLKLGYSPPQQIFAQAMRHTGDSSGDGAVDLQGLLGILSFIREKQVLKLRQSAGLPDNQVAKIRSKFGLRVEAGKHIELNDFERLMYDLFPAARHEQAERDKIRALIKQHAKGNGIQDLMEAYWIVRLYSDMRDEDKWRREQEAAQAAGFTNWQVASFREAFVAADTNADGCLSEREIEAVFDDLMNLNLAQIDTMRQEFRRLGNLKECIEFSEFLSLMQVILCEGRGENVEQYFGICR